MLMYNREPPIPFQRLVLAKHNGEDRYGIGEKLKTFADATRVVTDNIERSRFFNEDRLKKRANAEQVQVNDHVAIKAMARSALEPQYDFGWRVVRVEGNVITCVDPRTGKTRKVNRALIQIVPPEAHFDEENKRMTKAQKLKLPSNKNASKKSSKKDTEVEMDQEQLELDKIQERIVMEKALRQDPDWLPKKVHRPLPRKLIEKPTLQQPTQGQSSDYVEPEIDDDTEDIDEDPVDPTSDDNEDTEMRGEDVPLPEDDVWPPTPERPNQNKKRRFQSGDDDTSLRKTRFRNDEIIHENLRDNPDISNDQFNEHIDDSDQEPIEVDDNEDNQSDISMDYNNQIVGFKRKATPMTRREMNIKKPTLRGTKRTNENDSPPQSPLSEKKAKQSTPTVLRRSKRIENLPKITYDKSNDVDIYNITTDDPNLIKSRLNELKRRYVRLYGHEPRHKWFTDMEEDTWRKILSYRR